MVFGRRSSPFGVVDLFRAYLKLRGCAQYIICIGLGKGPTLLERVPHDQFQTATLGIQIMANDEYKEINYLNKKCYSACNSEKQHLKWFYSWHFGAACVSFLFQMRKSCEQAELRNSTLPPPTAISPTKLNSRTEIPPFLVGPSGRNPHSKHQKEPKRDVHGVHSLRVFTNLLIES